jgi:hypothetical protein
VKRRKQLGVALSKALRAELEHSALKHGHSLAEEIRQRLEKTYDHETADRPTRDLMDAVLNLAMLVRLQTGHDWHGHPAASRVLRYAIMARLARLRHAADDDVFRKEELPGIRLVAPESDDPETMGAELEALDHHTPRQKTSADDRAYWSELEKRKKQNRK